MRSNEAHKHFLFTRAVTGLKPGAKVLLVGLAFKPDTDDVRESPNIDLARKLIQAGYVLSIYDPLLRPEHLIGQNLGYAYAHLPRLTDLLVSKEVAEGDRYDLVIDVNGAWRDLSLKCEKVLDFHAL